MKTSTLLRTGIIALAVFFSACNSDSGKSQAGLAPAPVLPQQAPASPKPEITLYVIRVDKLNLREEPNKNGKVVTQFKEGDIVEGTGEVSANKEEVTLRGIPYTEPYYKVKSLTSDPSGGWAFGGALMPIYAGPRSTTPDLDKLKQLAAFLKTLNVKKIDSGKKAVDYVKANFSTSSGTLADAAFLLLESFLFRMETEGDYYSETERFPWKDEDFEAIWKDKFDMNKYPMTRAFAENGFCLAQGEGMIFPVMDWSKLADFFSGKVTPPMKEYILQNVDEQKNPAFDDGGIIVGLDTLAQRAVFWEKFNQMNPYFVRSYETRESERWLHLVMVNGADNTPVFDYETKEVTPDYKKVWSIILQKYPDSKLGKDVKTINDLLTAEGGKCTQKVEELRDRFAKESEQ